MSGIAWEVFDVLALVVFGLSIAAGPSYWLRGRASRWLIRTIGRPSTEAVRLALAFGQLALGAVSGVTFVQRLLFAALVVWVLDDLLYKDPPEPRRGRAKARLRMPTPVKLRPAERWAT